MIPTTNAQLFENEVRNVAAQLWPTAEPAGAEYHDGRERDAVFFTADSVHIVEATISNRKDKTEYDLKKSVELVRTLRKTYVDYNFKIWLVTLSDPTPDQNLVLGKFRQKARCPIRLISMVNFIQQLFDGQEYIRCRRNYRFGSIAEPLSDSEDDVPQCDYVPQVVIREEDQARFTVEDLQREILAQAETPAVLTGDFGAGKSMTLRHLYSFLCNKYLRSEIQQCPIYINLRDHFGQDDPAEALIRHATKVGLKNPHQLVAAWRAGYIILLLDGFDELASSRFVRQSQSIKKARKNAMILINRILREKKINVPVLLAGRVFYFDDTAEMRNALGRDYLRVYPLQEFDDSQIEIYLKRKGVSDQIPDWLPTRPLLLAILTRQEIFVNCNYNLNEVPVFEGWDIILDAVCDRESEQIERELDAHLIREWIERLATNARNTTNGLGPISLSDMQDVFQQIFDREPDERAISFLHRFAGLTSSADLQSRQFVDDAFVDACRAGDLVRFLEDPYRDGGFGLLDVSHRVEMLGLQMAASRLPSRSSRFTANVLQLLESRRCTSAVVVDVLHVMRQAGISYVGERIMFTDGFFYGDFEVGDGMNGLEKITFSNCYFSGLVLSPETVSLPCFRSCVFERVSGVSSLQVVENCVIEGEKVWLDNVVEHFIKENETNSDIMDSDLPIKIKVMMVILRKLFVQRGSGRVAGAFSRGIDQRARSYVETILQLVRKHQLAYPHRVNGPTVWIPNRSKIAEAYEILRAPIDTSAALVEDVLRL